MNMIQMVGLVTLIYFVTLALIVFNLRKINTRIGNAIFIICDVVFYFFWMYGYFMSSGTFTVGMLIGQISPLTCVILPLTLIMSEKMRKYAYAAVAFLNFGLFAAMFISPEHAYLFSFYEQATVPYTGEALCHMLCSLFGIYLVLTDQVEASLESLGRACVFIYSIIGAGIGINYLFHQSLFGMDPYGNYSIYMIDIFGSFPATLAAYLVGVLLVLILGLQSAHLLKAVCRRIYREEILAEGEDTANEACASLEDGKNEKIAEEITE